MKRIAAVLISVIILLCGCGTQPQDKPESTDAESSGKTDIQREMAGVWITYNEIKNMALDEGGFSKAFDEAAKKCRDLGITDIFLHTRAFCDSIYPSRIFPQAEYFGGADALKTAVDICHGYGMKIHAWINPYRVSTASADINTLPDASPAKKFLTDDDPSNDNDVCFTENGIFLNPSGVHAKLLVLSGIREILDNYDVDGIHFDDYFYPTVSADFDKTSYENYTRETSLPLTLEDWRRQNVNALLNACYCAVKQKGKDILFGVSPAADIDRCYNTLFADIEGWIGGGYIDYIMPQLYFGFEYPVTRFCFDNLLEVWLDKVRNKNVAIYCGLANYKIGTDKSPDNEEWNKYDDIIARQISLLRSKNVNGFVLFSYSSVFDESELNTRQLNKIKGELKNPR